MSFQKRILFLVLIGVTAITAACGTDENDPAAIAQRWVDAVIEGEGTVIVLYTCRASAEDYQMLGLFGGVMNNLSLDGGVDGFGLSLGLDLDVDMSDVTFSTVSQNEVVAKVRATGEMRMSMLGMYQTTDVDDEFTMVYEDKRWKVCASSPVEYTG